MLCAMTQPPRRPSWTDQPPSNWAEKQAHTISTAVHHLRGQRSAQWLSDRTHELGYRVTRSVITDLENGRRRHVTTSELLILSVALDVAPLCLLYPALPDGQVEAVPGVEVSSWTAYRWVAGETPLAPASAATGIGSRQLINAVRERANVKIQLGQITIETGLDPSREAAMAPVREQLSVRLSELTATILGLGGVIDD